MNMQDIIYLNSANFYVMYDCDMHIYNLLEPRHSKISSSTVAIDIIYCDSNNEDNYICSIPDLSFRFSDADVQAISRLIDEFEHGDN